MGRGVGFGLSGTITTFRSDGFGLLFGGATTVGVGNGVGIILGDGFGNTVGSGVGVALALSVAVAVAVGFSFGENAGGLAAGAFGVGAPVPVSSPGVRKPAQMDSPKAAVPIATSQTRREGFGFGGTTAGVDSSADNMSIAVL